MTQTLDVQVREPVRPADNRALQESSRLRGAVSALSEGVSAGKDGKTGAETARNGHSFLAIIEKMIAGAKEGAGQPLGNPAIAERGAAGAQSPGDPPKKNEGRNAAKPAALSKLKLSDQRQVGATQPLSEMKPGQETRREASLSPAESLLSIKGGKETAAEVAKGETDTAPVKDKGSRSPIHRDAPEVQFYAESLSSLQRTGSADKERSQGPSAQETSTVKEAKNHRRERSAVIGVVDERSAQAISLSQEDSGLKTTLREGGEGSAEMTITLRDDSPARGEGSMYRLSDDAPGKAQDFQRMLSQEIRSNAQEFVRAGQIVLRDGNSGSIRLNLHPETLGAVRINLDLNDKKVSGRIVVSSKEAYEAFREGLDGLSQAFMDSGFDAAGFDLSWSGDGSGGSGFGNSGEASSPFYASSVPDVMSAPVSADNLTGSWIQRGSGAVNVYA